MAGARRSWGMRSSQVNIDSPCHESWEAMDGGTERRFCGVCQKHVHDLSAMRVDDAQALLRGSAGGSLCVRYTAEPDGSLRFRDLVPSSRLTRGLVRAAFAASMLAACTPSAAPIVDVGDMVIESIRAATVPTPDGGCDYTTGPFTTFHLPPGHVLCSTAGDEAFTTSPIVVVPEPPPPGGAIEDPISRPTMGVAIRHPEPVEPFVPCDPPTYTPPPVEPVIEAPPPRVRMGDVAPKFVPPPPPPIMGGLRAYEPPTPEFAPPPPAPEFAPPPPRPELEPTMGSVSPVEEPPMRMGRIAPK